MTSNKTKFINNPNTAQISLFILLPSNGGRSMKILVERTSQVASRDVATSFGGRSTSTYTTLPSKAYDFTALPFGRMKSTNRAQSTSVEDVENVSLTQSVINSTASSGRAEILTLRKERTQDRKHVYCSLIAGLASGAISATVCAPLDLVRTRMQVMGEIAHTTTKQEQRCIKDHIAIRMIQDIIEKDGLVGCFRGLTATLLTVPTFWGVYFSFYDYFKGEWTCHFPHHTLPIIHLGSAITAGALSDLLCNPMFVVRTRLQTESLHHNIDCDGGKNISSSKQTIHETIRILYAEGGLLTFWRGMSANLLGLSHVAVQFPVYEKLKVYFRGNKAEGKEKTTELLLASGISKMSASILTYPHEVIRSRMMDIRSAHGIGFVETCRRVYSMEGLTGFYVGISVSLIRVIPNTMLTLLVYERVLHFIRSRSSS